LQNTNARDLGIARRFGGNRRYFAAVDPEIAQDVVIETTKRGTDGARMTNPLISRTSLSCRCAERPDRRGNALSHV